MFAYKTMFLIYESHGQYDDFTRIPLFVVDNKETAELIIEELDKALETESGEFWNVIDCYGIRSGYDHSFEYEEIDHVEIEWFKVEARA